MIACLTLCFVVSGQQGEGEEDAAAKTTPSQEGG